MDQWYVHCVYNLSQNVIHFTPASAVLQLLHFISLHSVVFPPWCQGAAALGHLHRQGGSDGRRSPQS